MRILHTGDLHLDSPFCSVDVLTSDKRRALQRDTLRRIFELAKNEKCDMILISGDLFDGSYVTPETSDFVCSLFASVDMPIVISPGNHDPYVNGSFYKSASFSENVYIFSSSELQCFDFPELHACVYGYAFTSPSLTANPLMYKAPSDSEGYTRLLCAHADLSSVLSRYAPITVPDILGLGVRYAALGHIHTRYDEEMTGLSHIRYCGFAEGRSFDEIGDGGVFIVDIEEDMPISVKRHIVSKQKYEICEIDVSLIASRSELISKIASVVENELANGCTDLRICLVGSAERETLYYLSDVERTVKGRLTSIEIKDLTLPVENIAELKADITLRGEFYRALLSGLNDENPGVREKNILALQIGLAAIDGRRIPAGKDEI